MTATAQLAYRFNGFRLDAVRRLLFGPDGQPIALKPKAFATLLYLVERPGQLVDKEALLKAVWPHVIIEENNLNKAISSLRQVFGETRGEHRFIVTEPGRGYRFVARVETETAEAGEPARLVEAATALEADNAPAPTPASAPRDDQSKRPRLTPAAAAVAAACAVAVIGVWFASLGTKTADVNAPVPPRNSIAVLPFDNLSPDPNHAYFAVGLHEAILSQLANVREMHVIARTSVQGYDGTQKPIPVIARELDVETVLEGSVRYADGRVLVTTHLADGATNASLWSDSYEHEFSLIFTIQKDIALDVAQALRVELLPVEHARVVRAPTSSLPAYNFYLQAVARQRRFTREEILLAIGDIEQAIELDPGFAVAWVLAANLHSVAPIFYPEGAAKHLSRAEQAARRALDLDPELGTAHAALGFVLAMGKDWTAAEAAYREALRRNAPLGEMSAYAMLNISVANFAYAREILEAERRVNPQNSDLLRGLMSVNAWLGDWDVAQAHYDSGSRLFMPWPDGDTLMMHFEVGRNELERARAIPATGTINVAMIAGLDNPQEALRALHRLYADPVVAGPPLNRRDIALWAGHFGDSALALAAMRSVVTETSARAVYLWMPQLKGMRRLPEFKALLRDVGIVAYWQEYDWPTICRPLRNNDFYCD